MLNKKQFPDCARSCQAVKYFGVCECECICPEKFDKNGNPIEDTTYMTTFDMDKTLETYPNYNDKRFDKEQTIFGKTEKGLLYNYSDRIWQWNYDKALSASKKADESGAKIKTARWFQTYLSAWEEKEVEIKHIIVGINKATLYPYLIFGYKIKKGQK